MSTLSLTCAKVYLKIALQKISEPMTNSVTTMTKIDDSDTKPLRQKLKNPDFIILLIFTHIATLYLTFRFEPRLRRNVKKNASLPSAQVRIIFHISTKRLAKCG